jgi:hypothetical protein
VQEEARLTLMGIDIEVSEDHKQHSLSSPIVIARRWDGLGARLTTIVNAWSVARALGFDFRFVWPRSADSILNVPHELFSKSFLENFEVTASEIADREVIPGFRPPAFKVSDARHHLLSAGATSVVDIDEAFDVLAFSGEDPKIAGDRFRKCFHKIGWSRASRDVIEFFSDWCNQEGWSALHIRAGDIVVGAWRNFIAHEKYIPTPLVNLAIETLSGADHKPLLVVSDNQQYVELLKQRYDMIRTPSDIFPAYEGLTALQQALADILALSRCRDIVGPRHSAFTGLAAKLASTEPKPADRMMPKNQERGFLLRGIEQGMLEMTRWECLKPLLARDICWYLDVFGDSLPLAEQIVMARRAIDLEPNFCSALTRLARLASLAGDHRNARTAARRALRIAKSVSRHADPLVESLSTNVAVECLALAEQLQFRVARRQDRSRANPMPILFRLCSRVRRTMDLHRLKRQFALCKTLQPYMLDHGGIRLNLHFQIAAVEWLTDRGNLEREQAAWKTPAGGWDEIDLMKLRASGLASYRRDPLFDPVVRDLERVTIHLSRLIGEAIFGTGQHCEAPAEGWVDGIFVAASGLQWICGWAVGGVRAVGLGPDSPGTYGGPIFLPRDDVAAQVKDPASVISGFAFPVPLHVRDVNGKTTANLVALTESGALRPLPGEPPQPT